MSVALIVLGIVVGVFVGGVLPWLLLRKLNKIGEGNEET